MRLLILALAAAPLALVDAAPAAAQAVVYCARPGVPVGCVARPVARRAVVRPGVGVRPGLGAGAVGVGVRPGVGLNAGGPVNRVGVR